MSQEAAPPTEKTIETRFTLPKDVHGKIKTRQRRLGLKEDRDVTLTEALIDLIRNPKLK
jgi:hypothetical protein